jgi:hypothetical protein
MVSSHMCSVSGRFCISSLGKNCTVYTSFTGWLKSCATNIKIFFYVCSSVQFDFINKHAVSLWLYKSITSRHVVTWSLLVVTSLSKVEVQDFFFFTKCKASVEHYLASRSHLACQNVFRDAFPSSPVPNKPTVSRVVYSFRSLQQIVTALHQTPQAACMHRWRLWTLRATNVTLLLVFCFQCKLFFWQMEYVSGMGCMTFWSVCIYDRNHKCHMRTLRYKTTSQGAFSVALTSFVSFFLQYLLK